MRPSGPKDTPAITWTVNAKKQMRFYGITERRVLQTLRQPMRREEGIAEGTTASMTPLGNAVVRGTRTYPYRSELWVMHRRVGVATRIIAAWKYPGVSRVGLPPEAPNE